MSVDLHIDSVRQVASDISQLPTTDGSHHYKVQSDDYILYLCLGPRFPFDSPRMTTLNGLPLYNDSEWNQSKLLGEEVRRVFSYLERLWGPLHPSGVDYHGIRNLAASCDNTIALEGDSLSRRTMLIGRVPAAAAVTDATSRTMAELEESIGRVETLSGTVKQLQQTADDLRALNCVPAIRFPKGIATKEGIRSALMNLHEEKDRAIGDIESCAMRVASTQQEFDSELSKLLSAYKEMHLLELQSKLIRSL